MLDLEYIKENSIYVVKFDDHRETGNYKEIKDKIKDSRDYDYVHWKNQPKELQEFHKAHYYAVGSLGRTDLLDIDDFYTEWSKNPNQFIPGHRKIIGFLMSYLERLDTCSDCLILNYDKRTIGNHAVGNWIESVVLLDTDFDVVEYNESYKNNTIIVQIDDEDLLEKLKSVSNRKAMEHDKYMGDGKYSK